MKSYDISPGGGVGDLIYAMPKIKGMIIKASKLVKHESGNNSSVNR